MATETTVLVLTGKPCAGKSTLVGILEDIGVQCLDTGDAIRQEANERYDDPTEDQIWDVAQQIRDEHGPGGPTIVAEDWIETQRLANRNPICISSVRDQAEVAFLDKELGLPTLVVEVHADPHTRSDRYVEMHLDDTDAVDYERVQEIRNELYDREERESPYPRHDIRIDNDNDVQYQELQRRLERLVRVMRA